jgi:glycosyltransferase involved in cell wall biosynthesis
MKTVAEPLVSIVTPLYNGEKYLEECIKSVLSQSYQNWEYIIVNNCSTDRSLEIARRLTEHDKRVRVHDNIEFLTSLQNFNHSLRLISPESKYCKNVHADDWIFPECISQMVEVAEKHPSIGVVGSYRLVGTTVKATGLPYTKTFIPGAEAVRMTLLDGPYLFGTPSSLLIRSDLIRSKEKLYNEIEFHQAADTEVCYDLLKDTDFGFVHQVLTFTRHHTGSITTSYDRLNALFASLCYCFIIYGPFFLSDVEFNEKKRRMLNSYYSFLGSRITQLADREFWQFHEKWFERMSLRLSWPRVVWAAIIVVCKKSVDFKQHLRCIRDILKRS